ncbi:hypothetical protein BC940DRAFT_290918 [Gongronella butleri]|nr:hypothetical protein BC940DRAFT_290918 [Gongronella butleri]
MFRVFLCFAVLGLLCQSVLGHYQLTYPPARGFSEDTEPTAPCGGFNSVSSSRNQFPLTNGFLEVNSEHVSYSYKVYFVPGNNPAVDAFNNATLVGSGSVSYPMQSCWAVNFGSLAAATNGSVGTLQAVYNAGDGTLYQCTDVVLLTTPTSFNASACINADGSKTNLGNSTSSTSNTTTTSAGATLEMGAVVMALSSVAALALAL